MPPPSPGFRARGRTPLPRWRLRPYRRPPDRPPALWTPSCFASEPRAAPPPRCGLRLRCPSPAASDQKPASGRPPDNRTAPVLPPDKRKRLDGHSPIRPSSDPSRTPSKQKAGRPSPCSLTTEGVPAVTQIRMPAPRFIQPQGRTRHRPPGQTAGRPSPCGRRPQGEYQ